MSAENWTFLTNHAHVLICLSRDPELRVRDLADMIGITERAILRILSELQESGYITTSKEGRRNTYSLNVKKPMRHPIESGHSCDDILKALS